MADGPRFRVAQASDAELLLDFMQAYYAFDGHGYDREKARAALVALLQNPEFGRVWLILDGDSPVGYAVLCFGYTLEWLGRDAFVDELYLREEHRGRGWGKKIMAFLEDAARGLGIRTFISRSSRVTARRCACTRRLDSASTGAHSFRSGLRRMNPSLSDQTLTGNPGDALRRCVPLRLYVGIICGQPALHRRNRDTILSSSLLFGAACPYPQ